MPPPQFFTAPGVPLSAPPVALRPTFRARCPSSGTTGHGPARFAGAPSIQIGSWKAQSAVWKSTFSPASSTLLGAGSIGMVFMYSVNFSQKSSITKPIV